jgi:hypothetical protein
MRAFYSAWSSDPDSEINLSSDQRLELYRQAWAYYSGSMFSRRNGQDWTLYLSDRELYKHTRLIFNPVPNVIDFYTDNLWKAANNETYPTLATPLLDTTDEKLTQAVAQLDQWGRWLSEKNKIARYTASTGSCLVEGIDDLERGKIYHKTIWPGYVKEVELNANGDVQAYTIEYEVYDHQLKKNYLYRKVVNKDSFSYFRDDKPFIPDGKTNSEEANPYGFCFAVWFKHKDLGGDYGTPAFDDFNKVDEINGLASHLHDNIHKEIESGKVIGVDDPSKFEVLTGATRNRDGSLNVADPRLERLMIIAKGNVSIADLSGMLKLAEAHPYLKEAIISIGADYPELDYKQILKENGTMSGIALERLLTPAQNRLDGVQAYYNEQLTKLRQMQISVGGMRANGGGWMSSKQQSLFKPFNLNSYQAGNLDFQIKESKLIEPSETEQEEILTLKAARAVSLAGIVDKQEQLKIAGYQESEAEEILQRIEANKPEPLALPEPQPNFTLPNREPLRLS